MSNIKDVLEKELERIKEEYGSFEAYRAAMSLRQIGQTTGEDD